MVNKVWLSEKGAATPLTLRMKLFPPTLQQTENLVEESRILDVRSYKS